MNFSDKLDRLVAKVMQLPANVRLKFYDKIRDDPRSKKDFPFRTMATLLTADPDLLFIPFRYISILEYERAIRICPKDPKTGVANIPKGYHPVAEYPTAVAAFPVLTKLLELDYMYYTAFRYGHQMFCPGRASIAYYDNALVKIPLGGPSNDMYTFHVSGFDREGFKRTYYACPKMTIIDRIKEGCDPRRAPIIVRRFFDPKMNRMPDIIVNTIGIHENLKDAIVAEWKKLWNEYCPGKIFFERPIPVPRRYPQVEPPCETLNLHFTTRYYRNPC